MTLEDDRTEEQRKTHRWGVAMTDRFLSGWGGATGGTSVAVWACQDSDEADAADRWVRSRTDALRVRFVTLKGYRPRGCAHLHIYLWTAR